MVRIVDQLVCSNCGMSVSDCECEEIGGEAGRFVPVSTLEPPRITEIETNDRNITLDIHGEPISGSQLKFNRHTGNAYRPTAHKQRVFTIYQYCQEKLKQLGVDKPYFDRGIPLKLSVFFYFPYRSGDYRTGKHAGELKPNAPTWVIGQKDLDNLLKPLKDGMKGVIYADDKQIAMYGTIEKRYSESPRTEILVEELV